MTEECSVLLFWFVTGIISSIHLAMFSTGAGFFYEISEGSIKFFDSNCLFASFAKLLHILFLKTSGNSVSPLIHFLIINLSYYRFLFKLEVNRVISIEPFRHSIEYQRIFSPKKTLFDDC